MTCATTWHTASHSTGFTLPGMIDEPGCRSGRKSSVRPVRGPEPIQRMSLLILFRPTAIGAQRAGQLDQAVAGALRLEVVARLGQRQAGLGGDQRDHLGGEAGRRVDAGADRGAAQRQLGDPGQRRLAAARRRSGPARRSRRTPGRGSPAWRPSGGCGRTSPPRRTRAAFASSAAARWLQRRDRGRRRPPWSPRRGWPTGTGRWTTAGR